MSRKDPKSPIAIRRGVAADAPAVATFGARAFEVAFGPANTPEDMAVYLEQAFADPVMQADLAAPAFTFLLAEDEARLVGYAVLRAGDAPDMVRGEAPVELARIYADPSRIGTGIGSSLMSAAIEAAAANGHRTLWLGVWERNPKAIAFYRHWGFRKVGEKPFVLGKDVQTDHVMAMRL